MTTPILYAHPFSSYSQKAFIAFYEKDVPFELRVLEPSNPQAGAELAAIWPLGKFPVLRVGDLSLWEATIVVEWLDQAHPDPARLIPPDPTAALQVRKFDRIFDNYVMNTMQVIVNNRIREMQSNPRDEYGEVLARATLDKVYAWLDGELAGRTWATGEAFTLADCAAAPSLFYADWVHPFDGHPNLRAYYRRLRERPSVDRAVEGGRPYRHYFPGGAPTDRD
ncbi:glutathione S-transferase family protein [Sorangium sp. So ce693]|uniref:glutathione S-transferase family protein n=1 Tax=Sorangium sp. So ce693 TaxID=3133318 RepID=UPI003F614503